MKSKISQAFVVDLTSPAKPRLNSEESPCTRKASSKVSSPVLNFVTNDSIGKTEEKQPKFSLSYMNSVSDSHQSDNDYNFGFGCTQTVENPTMNLPADVKSLSPTDINLNDQEKQTQL